jgi:conjugative relaxase-like TrwC/TraI family protein
MFTLAKIKDGGTYLERHLAANDYYCENESVKGKWVGEGARRLGLNQDIRSGDKSFENLSNNRVPDSTEKLTPRDSLNRVKFFDFQCSAQKSVSVMAVTMGDARLLQAHDAAAKLAFSEMEKLASRQANTALTRVNVPTGNVIAASFRHTASRALDPQVHTHFVTANATWDEKVRSWRALNEFEMFMAIRYVGKVYQNEMARSCRALGYEITESRDSRGNVTGFEIRDVPAEVCRRFSKRRAQVELGIANFIESHGREPTNGEIHAIAVSSRDRKLAEITTPAVLAAQREQLSPEELRDLTNLRDEAIVRSRDPDRNLGLEREQESIQFAAAHLYERRSVVKGHELLAEALNQNLGHQELSRLQTVAKQSTLVGLTGKDWLREHFATRQGLEHERWAVDFVNESRCKFEPLGDKHAKLSAFLSPEQRKAVKEVLGSIDQVATLRGAAGVGKTTVLAEIWREIELAGSQVFACAPTSAAADTMRKEGLPATTLAEFLENVAFREHDRLKDAVLIIDEGGLASNRQGAELLRLAERHSCRVLFIGDSRQHSSVEAGDFLRMLETHSHMRKVELGAIRRQEHQAYREAVGCLATGAARLGLEKLDELGWVKEGFSNYIRAAASDYARLTRNGKAQVLAVTPTWAEQEAFTGELRAKLKVAGRLGRETTLIVHEPLKWTKAQTRNSQNYEMGMVAVFSRSSCGFRAGDFAPVTRVARGRVFVQTPAGERPLPLRSRSFNVSRPRPLGVAAGDRILIRANDRHARLMNGEIVHIVGFDAGVLQLADGRAIDTAKFREFTHGYAVTSHASQSKTVDHVIVAAERLDAKSAYVACSRARHTCAVHTPDKAALFDRLPSGNRDAALDVLKVELTHKNVLVDDRWAIWTKAQEHFHALQATVGHALDIGVDYLKEVALRSHRHERMLGIGERHRERSRDLGFER